MTHSAANWHSLPTGVAPIFVDATGQNRIIVVKGANEMPGRIMMNFQTPDVKGEFERIKGLGAAVQQEPYQPGGADAPEMWIATFEDPDGNYFQLASPMPTQ